MMTLEQLLDLCLAQLNTGDKDLAMVLAQYPDQRAELEPMLRAALAVRQAPTAQPRPQAREAGKDRLVAALLARLSVEALDTALTLLKSGQPLDTALAESPYATELKPLLRMAQAVQQTPEPTPRLAAQAIGYSRLIAAVEERRRMLDQFDQAVSHVQAGQSVPAALHAAGAEAASLASALRAVQAVHATPTPTPRPEAKAAGLTALKRALSEQQACAPVLDRALIDLKAGQPLATVLARYPLYAKTLEPMLRTAQTVQTTSEPMPRPEAKAAGLTRLLEAVALRQSFEAVLDGALADLRAGRADIPMLLARYPEHAAQLEPMLLSAHVAQTTPPPMPRVRAKATARTQLMAAVAGRRSQLVAEKLDYALARVRAGASVEAVLATLPDFRADLEPLLQTALAVEQTPVPVMDRQARLAGERRLVQMAQARRRASRPVWAFIAGMVSTFNAPRGLMRQALIGAMAVLFFMSSTLVGVTRVAATSLPDEALYSVKLVTEQVQLALAPSPEARAQLNLAFAQERLRETQAAVDAGRSPARAIAQLSRHTEEAAEALDTLSPAQRDAYTRQLEQFKVNEKRVLEDVKTKVNLDVQTVIVGIVGTPTVPALVLAPTATWTPVRPTATATTLAIVVAAPAQSEEVVVPPTKTPLPLPSSTSAPAQPPTQIPATLAPPTQIPPTLAPTLAPTQPPAPTDTPPAVVVVPPTRVPQVSPGGSQPTRVVEPTATLVPPTEQPGPTRTPAPPTQTPLPQPTATKTPVTPAPTVIVPPTRSAPPTPTTAPPTLVPPTIVPPTVAPPTTVPPTSVPPTQPPAATTQPPAPTPQPTPKADKP